MGRHYAGPIGINLNSTSGQAYQGGWRPTQLSGCILWLSPELAYITKDGSNNVSGWANRGTAGSALDLAQVTGSDQPLWLATGGKNGGPAIEFDGANIEYMRVAYTMNQPRTWFVRGYVTNTAVNMYFLDGFNQNSSVVRCDGTGNAGIYAGTVLQGGALANSVYSVVGGVFDGASSVVSTNGVEVAGNAGSSNATGISVGATGTAPLAPLTGRIDLIVGYSRALTAPERAQLATWMASV